jgi:uncharacterized protein YuzE
MHLSAKYDAEADAVYVSLSGDAVVRTVELDDSHYVELGSDGGTIGIEVLYPGLGVRTAELAGIAGLDEGELRETIEAELRHSLPVTTTAATTVTTSTVSQVRTIEGTVVGGEGVAAVSISHDGSHRRTVPELA